VTFRAFPVLWPYRRVLQVRWESRPVRLPHPLAGMVAALFVVTGTLIYGAITIAKHWSKP
jgi:hypothetical protein